MKSKFKIEGLDCANCAAELESAIKKIEGITEVSISFMTERLVLEYNENMKDEIIEKMKKVINKEEPDVTIKDL